MTAPGQLRSGDLDLQPATGCDLAEVVALQKAAYAKNRPLLGVEPIPLLADYAAIFRDMEVWLARQGGKLAGALILEPRADDLLIWSIATDPQGQGSGLGRKLLAAAEVRAGELGRMVMRLYTGTPLIHLVAWYSRHGYAVERVEALSDRSITHMIKRLPPVQQPSVTRCDATRIALEHLEQLGRQSACDLALLDEMTIERSFGWVFFYQSKRYLQSGDFSDILAGNAPIVIARTDGRVHVTGTAEPLEYYLTQLAAAEGWNIQE